jgi:hypothetical protein
LDLIGVHNNEDWWIWWITRDRYLYILFESVLLTNGTRATSILARKICNLYLPPNFRWSASVAGIGRADASHQYHSQTKEDVREDEKCVRPYRSTITIGKLWAHSGLARLRVYQILCEKNAERL